MSPAKIAKIAKVRTDPRPVFLALFAFLARELVWVAAAGRAGLVSDPSDKSDFEIRISDFESGTSAFPLLPSTHFVILDEAVTKWLAVPVCWTSLARSRRVGELRQFKDQAKMGDAPLHPIAVRAYNINFSI